MKRFLKNILIAILSFWSILAMNMVLKSGLAFKDLFSGENYTSVALYENSFELHGNFNSSVILWLILFVFIFKLISKALEKGNKRLRIYSIVLAIFFAVVEVIANCINTSLTIKIFVENLGICIFKLLGLGIIYSSVLYNLFLFFDNFKFKDDNKEYKFFTKNLRSFFICFIFCLICWLPYFLKEFPGIVGFDNIYQLQVINQKNSFVHAMLLRVFVNQGKLLFNSPTIGIALCAIFQMTFMAGTFSYVVYYMAKKNIRYEVRLITLLYFAFSPAIALMVITFTRDTLFSGLMVLLLLLFIELITNTEKFFKKKIAIIFFIVISFLACQYRANEFYALCVAIPFIVAYKKGYRLKISLLLCSSILVNILFSCYVTDVLKVEKSPTVEMFSVPLQQIARAYVDNKDNMTDEEKQEIFKFLIDTDLEELYQPFISDPIKWACSEKRTLDDNKIEFLKLWFEFLHKYPVSYVDAFLGLVSGYINPQETRTSVWTGVCQNQLGIENKVILDSKYVSFIENTIKTQNIPIYSLFFNLGFQFWMFIVLLVYNIYKNQKDNIFVFIPILLYFLTICLGPLNNEFRYICFFFTCMPLLWTITLSKALVQSEETKIEELRKEGDKYERKTQA